MKRVLAFFRLIRWPNLVFIVVTQMLFYYFALPFVFRASSNISSDVPLPPMMFYCISAASVLIAAGGYLINDYYDIKIDAINKGSRVIIGSVVKKDTALVVYGALSMSGLFLSLCVGAKLQNLYIPILNSLAVLLLWLYSATFKKKLLTGNIIVSLLTAWVILIFPVALNKSPIFGDNWNMLMLISFLYGSFAFLMSLIREAIKDLEDMRGDAGYGCHTIPLVWGVKAAKRYCKVLLIILVLAIISILIYLQVWIVTVYALVALVLPIVFTSTKLQKATLASQFHVISSLLKWMMLAGILSMLFFYLF